METTTALIVSVSGRDRPGVLAALAGVLETHRIEICDIRHLSLYGNIDLHLVLSCDGGIPMPGAFFGDLLSVGRRMDLSVHFRQASGEALKPADPQRQWAVTIFGDMGAVAAFATVLADDGANIDAVACATHHGTRSIEMIVGTAGVHDRDRLKSRLMRTGRGVGVDVAVQNRVTQRKIKRMVCFDMDSTLVDMEGIDEMARKAGVYREVARITHRAMQGELDFEAALRQRVAMLEGLAWDDVLEIREGMNLSGGVDELLTSLRWLGFTLGIVSGGFDVFADHLKGVYRLDFAVANRLEVKSGRLTGRIEGEVIDAAGKARWVNREACDRGIPLDQVVAIGDGANDALMLGQAGLGIAYNGKPALARVAGAAMAKDRFHHVYHLLGMSQEDIVEAMSCHAG